MGNMHVYSQLERTAISKLREVRVNDIWYDFCKVSSFGEDLDVLELMYY